MKTQRKIYPLAFFNIHSIAKHKKIERGTFGEKKIREKSHNAEKNWKGLPFSLERYCMLSGKKPLWFSSLGQMFQVDIKKFRRTSKNYFGQFVWIEKKPLV